jgi:hypothetical protein
MSRTLSGFVVDLSRQTENGLSRADCDQNKRWLEDMVAAASVLPDAGLFGKKIHERWRAVAREYEDWNDVAATPGDRRKSRDRVYKKVNNLTSAVARRTELMRQQVDIGMYRAFYVATEKAVTAIPNILQSVAEALTGFKKP